MQLDVSFGADQPVVVLLVRTETDGELGNAPAGVTGSFDPAAPTGTTSVLTLTVGATVTPGIQNLTVDGTASAGPCRGLSRVGLMSAAVAAATAKTAVDENCCCAMANGFSERGSATCVMCPPSVLNGQLSAVSYRLSAASELTAVS